MQYGSDKDSGSDLVALFLEREHCERMILVSRSVDTGVVESVKA